MDSFNKNDLRCCVCLSEFRLADTQKLTERKCPNCGTQIPPQMINEDGYVKLNWQDLRVLAMYSRRWATMFDLTKSGNRHAITALENIINKILPFQPKTAKPLLPPTEVIVIDKPQEQLPQKIDIQVMKPALSWEEWKNKNKDQQGNVVSPFFRKVDL